MIVESVTSFSWFFFSNFRPADWVDELIDEDDFETDCDADSEDEEGNVSKCTHAYTKIDKKSPRKLSPLRL